MAGSARPRTGLGLWFNRLLAAVLLGGQAALHLFKSKIHRRNTLEQMAVVGPDSLAIALVTASFVGMVFTIQVAREFITFGSGNLVGGVLAIALSRELTPVLTAVVVAGRVGSAFAAELGTMRVTEQIDALYILKTDPIDYLVLPRLIACCLMLPLLTVFSLLMGLMGGLGVVMALYSDNISRYTFLNSIQDMMSVGDVVGGCFKSLVFGAMIATIGCSWGLTTTGGAKGVGQSTTTAVVTSLLAIFVMNFFLSWIMFQGTGSALSGGM
jgi:phospholipid/cholesterol/gamma-HCH transport system permease protein